MKKTVIIKIKLKNCKTVFKEELGEGVIGSKELIYDYPEEEYKRPMFAMSVMDATDSFRDELIEFQYEEKNE